MDYEAYYLKYVNTQCMKFNGAAYFLKPCITIIFAYQYLVMSTIRFLFGCRLPPTLSWQIYSIVFISITMIPFNTKPSKEELSWQESLPLFHISHNGLQGFRLTGNSNFKLYSKLCLDLSQCINEIEVFGNHIIWFICYL